MPDPDYAIDQAHPTMTDEIPRLVAHGSLIVKPEIARYDGERVLFTDGSCRDASISSCSPPAIGRYCRSSTRKSPLAPTAALASFTMSFTPSMPTCLPWAWCRRTAACGVSPTIRRRPSLAPSSRNGARRSAGGNFAPAWPTPWRERSRFVASERHRLEVNYFDYRRKLKRLNRSFGSLRKLRLGDAAALAPTRVAPVTRRSHRNACPDAL